MKTALAIGVLSILIGACDSSRGGSREAGLRTDGIAPTDARFDARPEAGSTTDARSNADGVTPAAKVWSMGYYASWQPGQYPVAEVEWSGLTHIAVAFYTPSSTGTLSLMGGNPSLATEIVAAAHAHNVKAIASIGGADSGTAFRQATASGVIDTFVSNLAALAKTPGFDGFDIDWEPLENSDEAAAIAVATKLRVAVPSTIMTIPIGYVNINDPPDLSGYPGIAAAYDQLNIMSYGMAGAWPGWKSWHCSPLYQTDSATPLSIDSSVERYLTAGVPKEKLGIGIGFYGLCYTPPVTGPGQALGGSTIAASDGKMSYANIMASYYSAGARQWDSLARVPYLSFSSAQAPDGCTYVSYDDEQSIVEKGAYLKSKGLGGVIQWEINEGYIASAGAGQRSPLLSAVRDHILH